MLSYRLVTFFAMRSNKTIFFILFFAIVLPWISACRKEKIDTPFTRMVGKWKKAKYATDDNNNGQIDTKEIYLVESGVNNELFFKGDSSGTETTNSSPALTFKWRIVAGSSVLLQYSANDTVEYNITNVSSVDLTLTTTTKLGLVWYYYIKE